MAATTVGIDSHPPTLVPPVLLPSHNEAMKDASPQADPSDHCMGLAQLIIENLRGMGQTKGNPRSSLGNGLGKKPATQMRPKTEAAKQRAKTMKNIYVKPGSSKQVVQKSIQSFIQQNLKALKTRTDTASGNKPGDITPAQKPQGTFSKKKTSCIVTGKAPIFTSFAAQDSATATQSSSGTLSQTKQPEVKQGKISDYVMGSQIGQGAYAVVKTGNHKATGKKVAIKIYEKFKLADSQRKNSVNREISLLKRLDHKNIVKLYDTIDTTKQLFLIMELVKGRSLYSYTHSKTGKKLEEGESLKLFKQVVDGITYCHQHNITHRDIKMENLLLDEKFNVKIIDFGFSICAPPSTRLKIFCGTPSYMAPEIVNKKPYIGPPTDVWSLGILLYALTCGSYPFKGSTDHELFRSISRCQIGFPGHLSPEVRACIKKMLVVDPNQRATSAEVGRAVQEVIAKKDLSQGMTLEGCALAVTADIKPISQPAQGNVCVPCVSAACN